MFSFFKTTNYWRRRKEVIGIPEKGGEVLGIQKQLFV